MSVPSTDKGITSFQVTEGASLLVTIRPIEPVRGGAGLPVSSDSVPPLRVGWDLRGLTGHGPSAHDLGNLAVPRNS
jgi:hypothetical protein